MNLVDLCRSVQPAVVAIVDTVVYSADGTTPEFADVIGTGFFVDETGIVVTNRHVVEDLKALPTHPKTGARTGRIFAFGRPVPLAPSGYRLPSALLQIDNLTACDHRLEMPGWYGSEVLDIGFIQVKATRTPALQLASALEP